MDSQAVLHVDFLKRSSHWSEVAPMPIEKIKPLPFLVTVAVVGRLRMNLVLFEVKLFDAVILVAPIVHPIAVNPHIACVWPRRWPLIVVSKTAIMVGAIVSYSLEDGVKIFLPPNLGLFQSEYVRLKTIYYILSSLRYNFCLFIWL